MHKADKEIYIRKNESMGWHMRDNVLYIVCDPETNYELKQYSSVAVLMLGFNHSRSNEGKKKPAVHLNIDCCVC
jgi:hypothetical protein